MSLSDSLSYSDSTSADFEPSLDPERLHPYCADDEVRLLLYCLRGTSSIPKAEASYQKGPDISFRYKVDLGDGDNLNLSANRLEIINKLFVYHLPDLADVADRDDTHDSLRPDLKAAQKTRHPCYHLNPVECSGPSLAALLHRNFVSGYSTADSMEAIHQHCGSVVHTDIASAPTLDWTPAYDLLLQSAWYEELYDAGISIRFRPRWSLYPTTATPANLEWPVIIPDVVFSVRIPLSDARLRSARQYHPAWAFSKDDDTLEIPLLIAVYNKAHPNWNGAHGIDGRHKEHLMACMTAALPVHAVLGLETPIAGLLFDQYHVYPFLGMMGEDSGKIVPMMHKIVLDASQPGKTLDLGRESLYVMHIYDIIASLRDSAKKYTPVGSLNWPMKASVALKKKRREIDISRPAWVVEDMLMDFLVSLKPRATIESWLRTAKIVLRPKQVSMNLPAPLKRWLHVFETRTRFGDAHILAVIEQVKKRLEQNVYDLIPSVLSSYEKLPISIPDPPTLEESPLIFDLSCSQTLCAQARYLCNLPVNEASANHWAVLYNSLFSRAWRQREIRLELCHHPQWTVHRSLREVGPKIEIPPELEELRPNCAFLVCLPYEQVILQRCELECLEHLLPEFAVTTNSSTGTGIMYVQMPVLVVEYVLIPDEPNERFKHLAHLSMALRSALALWELHHANAPVIGLLIDRNLVTMVLAYMDEAKKCIIREVSDYVFDVLEPYDAFRLLTIVKALGLEDFQSQITELIDAHAEEALDALLQRGYRTWKHAIDMPRDDVLGHTLTDADIPYSKDEGIQRWADGVQPSDHLEQPEEYL
ncbi:hypothetical protein BDZ89DRAFT_1070050 [Hymenopellis radicata]|nr:hypothetical protein BDZ89DRAFT_1070050 [Hymenopellis radicata]